MLWRATYYPALLFAHAQHRVALRRIAALGTPYWALWFALWLPLRAVAVVLLHVVVLVGRDVSVDKLYLDLWDEWRWAA